MKFVFSIIKMKEKIYKKNNIIYKKGLGLEKLNLFDESNRKALDKLRISKNTIEYFDEYYKTNYINPDMSDLNFKTIQNKSENETFFRTSRHKSSSSRVLNICNYKDYFLEKLSVVPQTLTGKRANEELILLNPNIKYSEEDAKIMVKLLNMLEGKKPARSKDKQKEFNVVTKYSGFKFTTDKMYNNKSRNISNKLISIQDEQNLKTECSRKILPKIKSYNNITTCTSSSKKISFKKSAIKVIPNTIYYDISNIGSNLKSFLKICKLEEKKSNIITNEIKYLKHVC